MLITVGRLRDIYEKLFQSFDLAPLTNDFESFYTRRLYTRIRDCWNRPVSGLPSTNITVLERDSVDYNQTMFLTGTERVLINLSSYNYLGFAENSGYCFEKVQSSFQDGISLASPRSCLSHDLQLLTEERVASFLGCEAAVVFSMGFATNSTTIPALVGEVLLSNLSTILFFQMSTITLPLSLELD